jgi:hypothetical protein
MRRFIIFFFLLLSGLLASCVPPAPTRVAASPAMPPIIEGKALVIWMFPPCLRSSGPVASMEEAMLCRKWRKNRIRVVEKGARLVSDFGVDQYGATYEEPGQHLYGAFHYNDHCTATRTDCVAALYASLLPGEVYFVTFRWDFDQTGKYLTYGRLEMTPVRPHRVHIFRDALVKLERVEPVPGHRELGSFGELRSFSISQRALQRIAQDRRDGVHTPRMGGKVFVEELDE